VARTVYIETSVVSYLAARPSRDLVTAARQQLTHEWWTRRRGSFELYVSEAVVAEARAGDPKAATRRSEILAQIPLLAITPEVTQLARAVAGALGLPRRAAADALHITTAAFHRIDFLLTWNSTHIANAELRPIAERACRDGGYPPPILCTPDELMGASND
jgi:predicted nucleic acid-binding protein